MGITITERKEHLSAMLHGGTLNRVRNIESLFERSVNTLLSKIDPIDTMRTVGLSNVIYDDIYNYALPSDYKKLIDLIPQNSRNNSDTANRSAIGKFDLLKGIKQKQVSIEGSEGSKIIRINWRSRQGILLNAMNSLTANGTWSAVGTATGLVADTIDYVSGSGSIRFDSAASGDGIQNTTMDAVDLSNEDEMADANFWFKIKNATDLANLTSVSLIWGNDLTSNYWTGVAQTTQIDGTAFKVGWNQIKIPWSTATETGTVAPATIDSAKITFATTGAISDIRVDNIVFSIGRNFDIKYYSKYLLKNTSGTWITKTTSDDDVVVLDNDAIQILLLEDLKAAAHQVEGSDSTFDIKYANTELGIDERGKLTGGGLYGKYKAEYPTQAISLTDYYGGLPARGRW
jgi:hypothetical protein